jgi:type III secretion protein W
MEQVFSSDSVTQATAIQQQKIKEELVRLSNRTLAQAISEKDFEEWCALGEFTIAKRKKFKTLKEMKSPIKKKYVSEEKTKTIEKVEKHDEVASKFQKRNYELNKQTLLLLRESIKEGDTADKILQKVLSFYKDHSLVDEALEFLLETTTADLKAEVQKAKDTFFAQFEREIKAGRNIKLEAQTFSKEGLGSTDALRNLYREVTGRPQPVQILFANLSKAFTFENMQKVIKFLFHSLGADLKSKGPSIARAELMKLVDDTKSLQAILGVYRFFKSRMNLVNSQFAKNSLTIPKTINFETLAKEFMKLISMRYISTTTVLQIGRALGLSHEILAQIIIYMQMRDATRNTALKLYKSSKHRREVLEILIEALENLEDELEEEEEEEEE